MQQKQEQRTTLLINLKHLNIMKRYKFYDCSTDRLLGQFSIVNVDPENYISEILLIFGCDLGKDIYFEKARINEKGIFEDITPYINLY